MNWLIDKFALLFAPKYVKAVARNIAVFVGAWLTKTGVNGEAVNQFIGPFELVVTGLITVAITFVLSLADKKKNQE